MIFFARMKKTTFVVFLLIRPVAAFMHFMDFMQFFIDILCFVAPFFNICATSCQSNNECNENQLCDKLTCDATNGNCVTIPNACDDVYEPVCGCDQITYGNDCRRQVAQVSKEADGQCLPVNIACTGNIDCDDENQFCDPPIGTCQTGENIAGGICVPIVVGCRNNYVPVCGCNGITYSNDCMRQNAQIAKDFDGPCSCGGIPGLPCPEGEFCYLPPGMCNNADLYGRCIMIIVDMVCPDVWDPVCGCDGGTYSNECYIARENVAIDRKGEC